MKLRTITIVSTCVAALFIGGCTAKERARSFGGTDTVELKCGQKMVEVTWKETTLWVATRPMREGEFAETYHFQADTAYGIMEGTVIIKEKNCQKAT